MTTNLSSILNNVASSIKANTEAISITSDNIGNANNEQYQRKEVKISSSVSGVEVSTILNSVNQWLQNKLVKQISAQGFSQTKQLYYEKIESLVGDPNSEKSLADYAMKLEGALNLLASNPESLSMQSKVILSANDFAQSIHDLFQELQSLRFEADQELASSAISLNEHLKNLKDLNALRSSYRENSNEMANLEQKISYKVEDIASYINVFTRKSEEGDTHLSSNNGITILDKQLYQFNYKPAQSIDQLINNHSLNPMQIYIVSDSGTLSNFENVVSGGKDGQRDTIFNNGKIASLQQLRDIEIPETLEKLDALAFQVAKSFNIIHNQGASYRGAEKFIGDKKISSESKFNLNGAIRIALIDLEGNPVKENEAEDSILQPLEIDLSSFEESGGSGVDIPLSRIIENINQYYSSNGKTYLKANIVDSDGFNIENGSLGYLQIKSTNGSLYRVILDELNSKINNQEGFFHTFGMNNLFTEQDGIKNSAQIFSVKKELLDNPQLLSVGKLKRRIENDSSSEYITSSSDNEIVQKMLSMLSNNLDFKLSSESVPQQITLEKYILSFMENTFNSIALVKTKADDSQEIYDNFLSAFRSQSGVNIDTELLDLMKYQSSINASAKIVSILDEISKTLLSMIH